MNDKSVMIWLKQKGWNILTSSRGGRHRQKYRYNKWSVINRNVLIVCWRTVYLTSRDLFKIQMDKSPLVKSNMQTKNGLYNSEAVQPPLLNWFNKNASSQVVTEMVLCRRWQTVQLTVLCDLAETVQLTVLCDLAETVQSSVKWLKL